MAFENNAFPDYARPVWRGSARVPRCGRRRRWDRLSGRHRVSQHLIREAMKAPPPPPTVRLCSTFQI